MPFCPTIFFIEHTGTGPERRVPWRQIPLTPHVDGRFFLSYSFFSILCKWACIRCVTDAQDKAGCRCHARHVVWKEVRRVGSFSFWWTSLVTPDLFVIYDPTVIPSWMKSDFSDSIINPTSPSNQPRKRNCLVRTTHLPYWGRVDKTFMSWSTPFVLCFHLQTRYQCPARRSVCCNFRGNYRGVSSWVCSRI